jgi:hypothetical protein
MAAPTICTISGVCKDTSGTAVAGATISATNLRPFIHTSDNSLILDYAVSTTTDASGAWSLNLVETTTPNITVQIRITYSTGANNPSTAHEYTILVPNSASATFASLIGSQL